MKELQQEAEMMSGLRSDFTVRFCGISEKPGGSQILVMECVVNGSLYDSLHPEEKYKQAAPPTGNAVCD